ncbi:hypothetical protein C2U69_18165 [Cupriavidus pinatubonensis]|nr:hypothetical protein C2U69_18165 [Cupriavidus pinatubonensis]
MYRGTTITAHAVEVGGGSTGFQYRYRGEIQRIGGDSPQISEFESPVGKYFANASAALEQCLVDGRALADTLVADSA